MALARPLGGVVQKPSARGRLHRRGGKSRRPSPCAVWPWAVGGPAHKQHRPPARFSNPAAGQDLGCPTTECPRGSVHPAAGIFSASSSRHTFGRTGY